MDFYNDIFSEYYLFDNQESIELSLNPLPINEETKFVCDECGLRYKHYSGLYSHKRQHDANYVKKYSCSLCKYSTDNVCRIKRHKDNHLKLNQYLSQDERQEKKCEIIVNQRVLSDKKSKYTKMYNTITGDFKCPICNKVYQYRQSIQVHLKSHEPQTTYRFNCSKCDFQTDHKGHFKRHCNNNH